MTDEEKLHLSCVFEKLSYVSFIIGTLMLILSVFIGSTYLFLVGAFVILILGAQIFPYISEELTEEFDWEVGAH